MPNVKHFPKTNGPVGPLSGGVTTPIRATGEIVEPLTPPDHKTTVPARTLLLDGLTPAVAGMMHWGIRNTSAPQVKWRGRSGGYGVESNFTMRTDPDGQTLLSHLALQQGWDRYAPHPPINGFKSSVLL